jgi:hypothetical protein
MIKCFFTVMAIFLLAGNLSAQPSPRPLPPELVERLRANYGFSEEQSASLRETGELMRFQGRNFSSLLLPDRPLAGVLVRDLRNLNARILVETLYVIPVEKGLPARDDFRLNVYNALHRIDTMKGLEYWSHSAQTMRLMFNDAFIIAGPRNRTPQPNPVAREILEENRRVSG